MAIHRFGSPRGQAALLGLVFLFVFTAYSTLQGFASQLFGPVLASNILLTLYAVFTLACFASPAVCNKLGPRSTAFLGCLCYGVLCLASLLLALAPRSAYVRPLCVLAGGVVGVGAALLWTAQGQLMLQYGAEGDMGRVFAVFWGLFNLSAVAGGFLTYAYFSRASEEAPVALYVIFCGCVLVGSCGVWLLKPPASAAGGGAASSWRSEAAATLRLFGGREAALLAPFYFYTGASPFRWRTADSDFPPVGAGQPYQLTTFGNRVFAARLLGLQLVVFYGAEVLAAWGAGRLLDAALCARRAARRQLALFAACTTAAYCLALDTELRAYRADRPTGVKGTSRLDVGDGWRLAAPTAAFALWGASDAQAQALAYWRIRRVVVCAKAQGSSRLRRLGDVSPAWLQRERWGSTSACSRRAGASALLSLRRRGWHPSRRWASPLPWDCWAPRSCSPASRRLGAATLLKPTPRSRCSFQTKWRRMGFKASRTHSWYQSTRRIYKCYTEGVGWGWGRWRRGDCGALRASGRAPRCSLGVGAASRPGLRLDARASRRALI